MELRDRIAEPSLDLGALTEKWLKADVAVRHQFLEMICLNWILDGEALVPEIGKPFHVLAEGLSVSSGRDDKI
jgi:site-specific DNA recombinase